MFPHLGVYASWDILMYCGALLHAGEAQQYSISVCCLLLVFLAFLLFRWQLRPKAQHLAQGCGLLHQRQVELREPDQRGGEVEAAEFVRAARVIISGKKIRIIFPRILIPVIKI